MKYLYLLLATFIFSSCTKIHTVFILRPQDIFGMAVIGIVIVVFGFIFLRAVILDAIAARRRKKRRNAKF